MLIPTIFNPNLGGNSLSTPSPSAVPISGSPVNASGPAALLQAIMGTGQQQQPQSTNAENIAALGYATKLGAQGSAALLPGQLTEQLTGKYRGAGMYDPGVISNLMQDFGGAWNTGIVNFNPSNPFAPAGGPEGGANLARYNLLQSILLNNASSQPSAVSATAAAAAGSNTPAPYFQQQKPQQLPAIANVWGGNQAMSGWGLPQVL
jgi:hypothetical protein